VKRAAADYLGGSASDVALTQSTTMGLSTVYHGLPLQPGDEVLLTTHDHYAHQESARLACDRSGARLRKMSLYDRLEDLPGITAENILDRIRTAIKPATRVLGMTWVHSSSGLRLPLHEIANLVRDVNAQRDDKDRIVFVVDGVHGFGVLDEAVADIGCDVFVSGTHKWILGPRGTGLIWSRPAVWSRMRPLIPTFDGEEPWDAWLKNLPPGKPRADWFSAGGFHAFEHEWAVADAFEFHASIGRKLIAARIHELNGQIKDGLARMPRVKLWTPRSSALSAGIVGFDIEGVDAEKVVAALLEHNVIASKSPNARPVARLAAGIMNTPEEVERALQAVHKIATM
jgi:selenocysteine lyase/cysteine desulfurase